MEDVHERPALRALTIGEIFDRAVTLYVRNFVVFTLIVLTLLVPIGVLQYFYSDKAANSFAQLMRQIQHPRFSADLQYFADLGARRDGFTGAVPRAVRE